MFMKNISATLKDKGKIQTKIITCETYADMISKLGNQFNVLKETIKIMKPLVKNQQTYKRFAQKSTQNLVIQFKANKKEQGQSKNQEVHQKLKQRLEQFNEAERPQYERIIRKLQKQKIKERDFFYIPDQEDQQEIFTTHYTSVVHLLRIIPQFKNYCLQYSVQNQNPDGLILQELSKAFKAIQGHKNIYFEYQERDIIKNEKNDISENKKDDISNNRNSQNSKNETSNLKDQINSWYEQIQSEKSEKSINQNQSSTKKELIMTKAKNTELVDPLQFCSAFMAYCADDIQFPFPTYDYNYIVSRIFETIHIAYQIQSKKKNPQKPLQLAGPCGSLFAILVTTKKKRLTPFDQEDDEGLNVEKQSIQCKYILQCDLSKPQTKTISEGIKKRFEKRNIWDLFYAFDVEYQQTIIDIVKFPQFLFIHFNRVGYPSQMPASQPLTLLPNQKSTHHVPLQEKISLAQFVNKQIKQKDKAQYQLIGCIYHKGKYYHHTQQKHTQDSDFKHSKRQCQGQFMVIVKNNQKEYLKFDNGCIERVNSNEMVEKKYWDGKEVWTPVLGLYRNKFYEQNKYINEK